MLTAIQLAFRSFILLIGLFLCNYVFAFAITEDLPSSVKIPRDSLFSSVETGDKKPSTNSMNSKKEGVFFDSFESPAVSIDKISGSRDIFNNSQIIYPKLFFSTKLMVKISMENNMFSLRPINQNQEEICLNKMQRLTMPYKHSLPFKLASGQYTLLYEVKNPNGVSVVRSVYDFEVNNADISTNEFIYYDTNGSYFEYMNKKVGALTGPNFEIGVSPVFNMRLNNKSSNALAVTAVAKFYERNQELDASPVLEKELGQITLTPLEDKIIPISLPAFNKPESYLANIILKNSKGETVSNLIEVRYVVKGSSANILDMTISKADNKLVQAAITYMGPADLSSLVGADLTFSVSSVGTAKELYKENKTVDLTKSEKVIQFLYIPNSTSEKVVFNVVIRYKGEILASRKPQYSILDVLTDYENEELNSNTKVGNLITDIDSSPFKEDILYLINRGYIKGYPDDTFRPENKITRAEISTMFCLLAEEHKMVSNNKSDEFKDVDKSNWAYGAINKAQKFGLIAGYPDKTFRALQNIRYAECFIVLKKFLSNLPEEVSKLSWAENVLMISKKIGISKGIETSSNGFISRAEVARSFVNMIEILGIK